MTKKILGRILLFGGSTLAIIFVLASWIFIDEETRARIGQSLWPVGWIMISSILGLLVGVGLYLTPGSNYPKE